MYLFLVDCDVVYKHNFLGFFEDVRKVGRPLLKLVYFLAVPYTEFQRTSKPVSCRDVYEVEFIFSGTDSIEIEH